jgi:amino acid permease
MAYKNMDQQRYVGLTLLLNLFVLILAILIDDLGIMLDIISSVCCTAMIFLMPGFFYLYSVKKCMEEQYDSYDVEMENV